MIDDDDLWGAAVSDVTPLKGKEAHPKAKTSKKTSAMRQDDAHLKQNDPDWHGEPSISASIGTVSTPGREQRTTPALTVTENDAKTIAGHGEGVDGKLRQKLARGEFGFSARLDLHGYYEGDAWLATMDFVHQAADSGHRCVLIIHGKGKGWGSEGDMGIIKAQMAGWLAHHPKVLAFHTAIPRDGGSGAVYVYLRRNRTA